MTRKFFLPLLAVMLVFTSFIAVPPTPTQAVDSLEVITVPYIADNSSIPHPAYNGHPTTFKAVCRGNAASQVYFRWDIDGDGEWDTDMNRTLADYNGKWYVDYPSNLDFQGLLPYIDPNIQSAKLFQATIEVRESIGSTIFKFGTYPVMVYANVPAIEYAGNPTDGSVIDNATPEQLSIMNAVAMDDALWALHKRMQRSGTGTSGISGFIPGSSTSQENHLMTTAMFALTLLENQHYPAYPPGTYNDYSQPVPVDVTQNNDSRYNNDPYSEDTIRALNYILTFLQQVSIPNALDEGDDAADPIPGTNDAKGYFFPGTSDLNVNAWMLAALAKSGLAGTMAQVGTGAGKSIEFVVQQMVDYGVYAQIDENSPANAIGGWYNSYCNDYGWGPQYANAYISSGWYYALQAAEAEMEDSGVYVNNRLKSRLSNMLYYNQSSVDGGCYYNNAGGVSFFEPTGLALLACRWLGWDQWAADDANDAGFPYLSITKGEARQVYDNYRNYIGNNWNASGGTSGYIDPSRGLWESGDYNSVNYQPVWNMMGTAEHNMWPYSLFSVAAGASEGLPVIADFALNNWLHDFSVSLMEEQNKQGFYVEPGMSLAGSYTGLSGITALAVLAGSTNHLPVADAGGPYHTNPSSEIILNGSASYDPDEGSSDSIVSYVWDIDSDGQFNDASGVTPAISVDQLVALGPGNHPVMLKVTDTFGAMGISITSLEIEAQFSFSPYYSVSKQLITFDARAISDSLSGEGIVDYQWDFGDGGTGSGELVYHAYAAAGNYHVTLTVTYGSAPPVTFIVSHDVPVYSEYVNSPPVAHAGGPYLITPGMGLTLDGSESWDPNESTGDYIASYDWDLDNDSFFDDASGETVALSSEDVAARGWDRIGVSIPISLRVTDTFGVWRFSSQTQLQIMDVAPPKAVFSITPENPAPNQTVTFNASASQPGSGGTITTYEWQFDDNTMDTGTVVTHTYPSFGRYPVRLQVTDSNSITAVLIRYVNINSGSNPPVADHGGQYMVPSGDEIQLNAGRSSDPDIGLGDYIARYRWNLNADGIFIDSTVPTATLTPAHFTALGLGVGTHAIILEVTDSQGESDTTETTLTIFDNLPPVADAGGPYFTGTGEAITLDGSASCDPNADTGDSIISYEWDINDDGVFDDATGDKPVISEDTVTTLGLGVHPLSLRVTDTSGATGTGETTLGIYINEPVASFTITPQGEVSAGQPASLNATGSYQSRPDRTIVSYDWDFGDGTTGSGKTTSHTFPYIGQFTITLTVTDDNVPPQTDQATAIIINAANSAPMADAGGPYVINIGDSLSLDGSDSTDPDIQYGDTIVSYEWDINEDGVYDTSGSSPQAVFNWEEVESLLTSPGVYPADPETGLPKVGVRLRVTDSTDRADTDLTTLTIYDNSPAASLTGETRNAKGDILPDVTVTIDEVFTAVSDPQGNYEVAISTTGLLTVIAGKDGYRPVTTTVNATDLTGAYLLDFKGKDGLVPNAPDLSFVLACINKWSFPPADGTELEIEKVIEVINAWKYPVAN